MYNDNEVIRYFQSNQILALRLERALSSVGESILNQIETIGAGAKRALYYASCFTDEYQDVCRQQKNEDTRFVEGVIHLLQKGNVIYDMLQIYFFELLKYKTNSQLEHIKQKLMAMNVHIAASTLTGHGFALATAICVAVGMNLSVDKRALAGRKASTAAMIVGLYGIVQKAAESARRLYIAHPSYYAALYAQGLEMMYFLLEPLFERSGALKAQGLSDNEIADLIKGMIG